MLNLNNLGTKMCLRHKVRLCGGFVRALCLLPWLTILPADVLARNALLTGNLHNKNTHHKLPTFEWRTIIAFNNPDPSNCQQGFTSVWDQWEKIDFWNFCPSKTANLFFSFLTRTMRTITMCLNQGECIGFVNPLSLKCTLIAPANVSPSPLNDQALMN